MWAFLPSQFRVSMPLTHRRRRKRQILELEHHHLLGDLLLGHVPAQRKEEGQRAKARKGSDPALPPLGAAAARLASAPLAWGGRRLSQTRAPSWGSSGIMGLVRLGEQKRAEMLQVAFPRAFSKLADVCQTCMPGTTVIASIGVIPLTPQGQAGLWSLPFYRGEHCSQRGRGLVQGHGAVCGNA